MKTQLLIGTLLLVAGSATALNVETNAESRVLIEGPTEATCLSLAETAVDGVLTIDAVADGNYTDGTLNVLLDVEATLKNFSFESEGAAVTAVFVEAGSEGHFLYTYSGADVGVGLTTPGGSNNTISQISFCYVAADVGLGVGATLPCPTQLSATANADSSILLLFMPALEANGTVIERAETDGAFETIAVVDAGVGTYVDSNTTTGASYTYRVTSVVGADVSIGCEEVEVTSVPVFPTVLGSALALGLGALAFAGVRRRS